MALQALMLVPWLHHSMNGEAGGAYHSGVPVVQHGVSVSMIIVGRFEAPVTVGCLRVVEPYALNACHKSTV